VNDGVGELKRMFVRAGARRRGFARAMLDALERVGLQRGYRAIVLETGAGQPEAIALYQSAGYRSIPPYGEFVSDDRARCFEKRIGARDRESEKM
jgi:GNAT superfamily N-acetyltransferase